MHNKNSFVVVANSYSGRSIDLIQSIDNAKKAGVQVIAITASSSPLANEADIELPLGIEKDSDHYAPTKSRLAQLVILDILAVGVAKKMGRDLALPLASANKTFSSKNIKYFATMDLIDAYYGLTLSRSHAHSVATTVLVWCAQTDYLNRDITF